MFSGGIHIGSGLKLALDGKIYIGEGSKNYISVIHEPNKPADSCYVDLHSVNLGSGKCEDGFPNFIQSYFFKPSP